MRAAAPRARIVRTLHVVGVVDSAMASSSEMEPVRIKGLGVSLEQNDSRESGDAEGW